VVVPWPAPGSSLWSIALIEYGNGSKWPCIYNANQGLIGPNPNLIHPGQVLQIPANC
jgi:nucleoid-associated protein YgaU